MSLRPTRRALLLVPLTLFSGCDRPAPPPDNSPVSRVISLSPATTEALFALGLGNRLVGRSRFCNHPPEALALPSVGGFVDPSFEAILALSPRLVVGVQGPGGPAIAERLTHAGIDSYFPATDSFDQIISMTAGLGDRLGAATESARLASRLKDARVRIARKLSGRARPRALLVFGLRPIVAAGRDGFPDEMLRLAGAENVVTGPRYPTLGVEQLLALDPDVVIDATGAAGHDGDGVSVGLPGWSELRAVRAGRLVALRDDRVLRPGPRIGEGLEVLARAIHPELFG